VCRLLESVRLLRRPLIRGLCSPIFLRVLRVPSISCSPPLGSRSEGNDPSEEIDLLRFLSLAAMRVLDADSRWSGSILLPRPVRGDPEALVDIVATDAEELDDVDLELPWVADAPLVSSGRSRFRPLSFSTFASCSSATPFLDNLSA
jgi:hypothetical protein